MLTAPGEPTADTLLPELSTNATSANQSSSPVSSPPTQRLDQSTVSSQDPVNASLEHGAVKLGVPENESVPLGQEEAHSTDAPISTMKKLLISIHLVALTTLAFSCMHTAFCLIWGIFA